MKRILTIVAVMAVALMMLESCGPARYTQRGTNLASVQEFAFIEPYSYMIVYGDDGKGYYNESNSRQATQLITSIVESERYPFSDVIPADYEDDNSDIRKWVTNFDENTPSRADRLRVPKSLKTLVKNSGNRYGIVIYSFGYTQTVAGYQREKLEKAASKVVDKAIESLTGISGLTNPSRNYYVSDPYGNIMYCAVVDVEEDRVVNFVREVPTFGSHPLESQYVSELLHKLLKDFAR
jgi:hypothetical protein